MCVSAITRFFVQRVTDGDNHMNVNFPGFRCRKQIIGVVFVSSTILPETGLDFGQKSGTMNGGDGAWGVEYM
jgi:hypothetical protein